MASSGRRHLVDRQQLQDGETGARAATRQRPAGRRSRRSPSCARWGSRRAAQGHRHGGRPGSAQATTCSMTRGDALVEHRRFREQAEDEERLVGKVEEETRVREHTALGDQRHHQVFLAPVGRNAKHRRPSTLGSEQFNGGICHRGRLQRQVVGPDPLLYLVADLGTTRDQRGRPRPAPAWRPTGRCRRSTRAGRAPQPTRSSGPSTRIHPSFTCGRPADFDSPPR